MKNGDVSCTIAFWSSPKGLPVALLYLKETLLSASTQGFAEIILVNDGTPPHDVEEIARLPNVRLIHIVENSGEANARNVGIKACLTPYVVMMDGDDLFCPGYLSAMISWVQQNELRCGAATLRYVGSDSRRHGLPVSLAGDTVIPCGFFAEVKLIEQAGFFPTSLSPDAFFFRSLSKEASLRVCPDAKCLYRVHPRSTTSTQGIAIWSLMQMIPAIESGELTLGQANAMARGYAETGIPPQGMEERFAGVRYAFFRKIARTGYACWLNRDYIGVLQHGLKLIPYISEIWPIVRRKWLAPAKQVIKTRPS